jgi:hypothetical protein
MTGEQMNRGTRRLCISMILVMSLLFAYNSLHAYVGMEGLAFWGYPYISSFSQDADKGINFKKYRCPLFIATGESKQVGVSLTNTTGKTLTAYVQTVFSNPSIEYGVQHEVETIALQAGETKQATWRIDQRNIVNGSFVLTRSFVSWQPVYVSNRSVSCHSLVLNFFGVPSNLLGVGIFVLLGLATVALAALFIHYEPFTKQHNRPRSTLIYLLVALAVMTIGSLIGSWLLGFLMFILILLGLLAFLQTGFT